ncbi:MAG: heme-binding protein [Gluconacetobacter diazotrophicus]|nr:heme-binding protein [Gluconacetobacter diazotrophicus]
MRRRIVLTASDARALMEAAREEAERRGIGASVAVVDEAGVPMLLERLDGARLHTPDAATLKARTAAITRSDTRTLQEQVHEQPAMLSFPGRMPLAGGMPIEVDGEVVGAVGCSGGQPEDDEAVCRAALTVAASLDRPGD